MITIVVILVAAVLLLRATVRIVQQGQKGVIKRMGRFHSTRNPGLSFLIPVIDSMTRVDMREVPRRGDKQDVITKDNVAVGVSATIFHQVVDVNRPSSRCRTTWSRSTRSDARPWRAVFGTIDP
ncbi:Band 7 protein, partial [mine drainage metagenome]